jgi:aerobic C4-dicarboxylate transport protein
MIGNGVGTLVIARWEGVLDREALDRELRGNMSKGAGREAQAPHA